MYYRRKVILALLQQFGGEVEFNDFQQLLFLFTRKQQTPAYHFVPGKQGAYSFQAPSDKGTMIKYELLKDREQWVVNTEEDYVRQLKDKDQKILKDLYAQFKNYSFEELVRHKYRQYPYYAIRSEIVDQYLEPEDVKRIEQYNPVNKEQKLYTIGYEDIKAEAYMNRLLKKDVRLLVDVRKNSMSMKYGFNKNQLREMCSTLGLGFQHISALGIASDKRKDLETEADYEALFREYEQETLPDRREELEELYQLYRKHKRVAITCFEKEPGRCHRHKVSDYLQDEYGVAVEHL